MRFLLQPGPKQHVRDSSPQTIVDLMPKHCSHFAGGAVPSGVFLVDLCLGFSRAGFVVRVQRLGLRFQAESEGIDSVLHQVP